MQVSFFSQYRPKQPYFKTGKSGKCTRLVAYTINSTGSGMYGICNLVWGFISCML